MKNKKMSAASNKPQATRLPEERAEKGFGSKPSTHLSDSAQTKKTQSSSSQADAAVKSKNTK